MKCSSSKCLETSDDDALTYKVSECTQEEAYKLVLVMDSRGDKFGKKQDELEESWSKNVEQYHQIMPTGAS